jgi:nucleoid DNA-binding protein
MALKREHLKDAKAALKAMSARREKTLRKADFIAGLIHDIHAKMAAGFTLEEICEELNKALPDGEQIKMNTFKTYVRKARTEAGMAPTRSWTRRTAPPDPKTPASALKGKSNTSKGDPASGFRDQGGDL